MMKNPPLLDKQAPGVTEEIPRCERCNRPLSPYGCRVVPLGTWCLQYGLAQDPRTIITSVQPDPLRPLVEQDPRVKQAARDLANAQADFNQADAAWRSAAQANVDARRRLVRDKQDLVVDGRLVEIRPQGTSDYELAQLDEAQAQASIMREAAHDVVVKVRTKLESAKRRARARLSSAAA
jgi:hypothetical protein